MSLRRMYVAWMLLVPVFSPAAVAQEGRVTIAAPAAKELKRTAHRMRLPVERLKNIREALQLATNLARRMDPVPIEQLGTLAQLYVQLNRPEAGSTIDLLLAAARSAAETAANLSAYQQGSSAFQNLLRALIEIDVDRAVQLSRQWPITPQALGEEADWVRTEHTMQFKTYLVQRLLPLDPEKAASLYADLGRYGAGNWSMRAQLAVQLVRSNRTDQAYGLIDAAMADFQSRSPDANNFRNFTMFLSQVAAVDPARFMAGVSLLAGASGDLPGGTISGATLTAGDRSVALSSCQYQMLELIRALSGRPELAMKTLHAIPGLKEKLDQIGGIDNFFNPSLASGGKVSFANSPYGARNPDGSRTDAALPGSDKLSSLFKDLKGKAATNPTLVRRKLAAAVTGPGDVDLLINLAQRANYEDPDLSSLAFEAARPLMYQVQPLEKRSNALQSLVRAIRNCEGEVDTELLRDGFLLADQLRQEEREKSPQCAAASCAIRAADSLEQFLIGETAADDFGGAMKYLQTMPDDETRLRALFGIVGSLRQN